MKFRFRGLLILQLHKVKIARKVRRQPTMKHTLDAISQNSLKLKHCCTKLFLVPPYTLHMTNNFGHALITRFKFMVTKNHTIFHLKL
jgi:hypothetical protein